MKKIILALLIIVFLFGIYFFWMKRSDSFKKPAINFLDTSLTFYVDISPDARCVDGEDCSLIYKVTLYSDQTYRQFPYKVVGQNIDVISDVKSLGFLRQDDKSKTIVWRRMKSNKSYEDIELQDLKQQEEDLFKKFGITENDKLVDISSVVSQQGRMNKIDMEKLFHFMVRVFSYDIEPKEVSQGPGKPGLICVIMGAGRYQLVAIEQNDKLIYTCDNFFYHRKRFRKF